MEISTPHINFQVTESLGKKIYMTVNFMVLGINSQCFTGLTSIRHFAPPTFHLLSYKSHASRLKSDDFFLLTGVHIDISLSYTPRLSLPQNQHELPNPLPDPHQSLVSLCLQRVVCRGLPLRSMGVGHQHLLLQESECGCLDLLLLYVHHRIPNL